MEENKMKYEDIDFEEAGFGGNARFNDDYYVVKQKLVPNKKDFAKYLSSEMNENIDSSEIYEGYVRGCKASNEEKEEVNDPDMVYMYILSNKGGRGATKVWIWEVQ